MENKSSFHDGGDTLEVKIRDSFGSYYFKAKALINHKKQMMQLIKDLKNKGVSFPSGWFD